jgi:hypothetical protein
MNRYVTKAAYEVHQADLPDGVFRQSTGAWVMDTEGKTRPVWFSHITDAREKANLWNRRYSAGLTT